MQDLMQNAVGSFGLTSFSQLSTKGSQPIVRHMNASNQMRLVLWMALPLVMAMGVVMATGTATVSASRQASVVAKGMAQLMEHARD
jgi:hypothetical protein